MSDQEQIPYVNASDEVLGQAARGYVTENKLIRRSTRVMVVDQSDLENLQFLLQFRSPTKSVFPSTFDQSIGGHVDAGESYLEAAIREAKEELNLELEESNLKEIAHYYSEETSGELYLRMYNKLYLYEYDGQEIEVDGEEVSDFSWMRAEEIDEMFEKTVEKMSGGLRFVWPIVKEYFISSY